MMLHLSSAPLISPAIVPNKSKKLTWLIALAHNNVAKFYYFTIFIISVLILVLVLSLLAVVFVLFLSLYMRRWGQSGSKFSL